VLTAITSRDEQRLQRALLRRKPNGRNPNKAENPKPDVRRGLTSLTVLRSMGRLAAVSGAMMES
jgi:hypothetical protein